MQLPDVVQRSPEINYIVQFTRSLINVNLGETYNAFLSRYEVLWFRFKDVSFLNYYRAHLKSRLVLLS